MACDRVANRLFLVSVVAQPFRGPGVDGGDFARGDLDGQPPLQRLGEQLVVAQPCSTRIERNDEQAAFLQLAQEQGAAVGFENVVAEFRVQLGEE